PESEPDLPLAERARYLAEAVQVCYGPCGRINPQVRDVRAGIVEVRRVGEVERLGPELDAVPLFESEFAEEAEVPLADARPSHDIPACCAEASLGYRLESQRIEVRLSFPMPAEYFHFRFHEIGSLRTTRRVQRRTRRSHVERSAAVDADEVIDLPASHNRGHQSSVAQPSPTFAEGQLEDVRDLQVMRAVDVGP